MVEQIFSEALARCGGDKTVLKSMAMMISEDAPHELEKLILSIESDDNQPIVASAHCLKGMLTTFKDGAAVRGLQHVEDQAMAGDVPAARQHLQECLDSVEMLIAEIKRFSKVSPS